MSADNSPIPASHGAFNLINPANPPACQSFSIIASGIFMSLNLSTSHIFKCVAELGSAFSFINSYTALSKKANLSGSDTL